MKTRRISLWADRQANLIPASFYKNFCGLCGNLFMSICQNTTSIGSASDTVNVPTSRPPDTETCSQCGALVGELYRHEKRIKNPAETTGNRYKIEFLMSRTQKLKGLSAASLGLETIDDNPYCINKVTDILIFHV